ncbi:hypothetical protein SAMN04489761_2835 [Tenacibaculum sp. MAR_2009_124]|uniref:hypothetical protein n=1 Tax=Tenacibaculum sp. MAR_2009_124 TaxID=1250059 RepID=UPI00089A378B|nr:hypothetical protein [Tenacibaculum sp. MAR_2009_124]SEC38148.1 hypothetical protein SAMN04489761_2835 [Tenacibaculum sp. MAR_2009_124]
MSKKPIKSNLFRFVTLRGAQTIEDKEKGFVEFPESKKGESLAFKAVQNVSKEEERKQALKSAFNTGFIPIEKKEEVKGLHAGLYEFSNWLVRHKNDLSYAAIASNLNNAQVLTLDEERLVWDNLFYQTINKASVSIREYLIQLLVTNQFLKAFRDFEAGFSPELVGEIVFTDEDEKNFIRRANASVVIPKEVVLSSKEQTLNQKPTLSTSLTNYMKADLKVEQAKKRADQYKQVLSEIEKKENIYRRKEDSRYKIALNAYNAEVASVKEAAKPTVHRYFDVESGLEKSFETYPNLDLAAFEYIKAKEIDRGINIPDADLQFSSETLDFLNLEEIKPLETFDEVKEVLNERIKTQYKTIFNSTPERVKNLNVLGESVSVNVENQKPLYSYTGHIDANKDKSFSVFIRLKVENSLALDVNSSNYELTNVNGDVLFSGTTVKLNRSISDTTLVIELFPDKNNIINKGVYKLKASFSFSNGISLEFGPDDFKVFADDGYLESSGIFGRCIEVGNADSNEGGEGVLYGVSQLGIADFRRVEQEICCYVPGEVSHIENIMAREYKERSTSNLISYESTTEKNSEKESENLTDTTSTERNELQNETTSIVNKDSATTFGASAGYSGFGASVSLNYGSSSNNSISDSNLKAKTYAQDVTERALERVIQKTSVKRTSRMLQEFEENNSHGFDNSKGERHINGVYRWVDKVYKNKMVNYGKRLMYEFALPEPAKFLLNSKEDGQNDGLVIQPPKKPIHPKDLENNPILNSSDIKNANYQLLESIYNVDIDTPNVSSQTINAAQTGTFQRMGGSASYVLQIPEGYSVDYFEVAISGGVAQGGVDRNCGMGAIVGGEGAGKWGHKSFHNSGSLNKIKRELHYSIRTWDIGAFDLSLKVTCNLTSEAGIEWQRKAYKKIIDGYNTMLRDYKIDLEEYESKLILQKTEKEKQEREKEGSALGKSSLSNRIIEKRELKRVAIDLMTKPFNIKTAKSHYENENYKTVKTGERFQNHLEVVKFFEQAFDWEIMAYTFYPYFYGAQDNWKTAVKIEGGNDPIFKAFLQSAMARAVIPVRSGFEDAVNWFMKTGEIWNGKGMVTDMDDDLYLSIAEELQTIQGEVEDTWETRVPTSLTVLQADSVALNEGGLPCNPTCEGNGLFDTVKTSPDGVDFDIVGQTNEVV